MSKKIIKGKAFNLNIAVLSVLGLVHIVIALLVFFSYRYYGLEMSVFLSIIGAVVLFLVLIDIVFIVGYKFKDMKLKIGVLVISTIILLGSGYGLWTLSRVNTAVDSIIENQGTDQYEEISVDFITYDNSTITELDDLTGKKVGVISSTEISPGIIGQEKLEAEEINATIVEYTTLDNLFLGLINDEIDAGIFQSGYKAVVGADDAFEEELEKTEVIFSFVERVKTGENPSANLDLATEPFNILLIGYAPNEGGGGLADTIMIATVNPQTLTVGLTSIPRDSYVAVSCWGGNKTKINHARSTSRQCLMDTVGDVVDVDIDFYMEVNFDGIVEIVDAADGIWIDSPVEFVGQSSSVERGEMTVWVGKGGQWANGEQALAFARERYAMPDGDFARQVHQQEVIMAIVEKLMASKNVNTIVDVLEAAGKDNITTNMSLPQLTELFSYLMNVPNNNNMPFNTLYDMQSSRLTGYYSSSYDFANQRLSSIVMLYDGSIADSVKHIGDVLGEFDEIDQLRGFEFYQMYPYNRAPFYSEFYNEAQNHPPLPPMVKEMRGLPIADVQAWAAQNGVNLNVVYIQADDPRYNANAIGSVIDQSHRAGLLLENIAEFTVWVSGEAVPGDNVPDFMNRPYSEAETWAASKGYVIEWEWIKKNDSKYDSSKNGLIYSQSIPAGTNVNSAKSIKIGAYEYVEPTATVVPVDVAALNALKGKSIADVKSFVSSKGLSKVTYIYIESDVKKGTLISYTVSGDAPTTTSTYEFTFAGCAGNIVPNADGTCETTPSATPTATPTADSGGETEGELTP